MRARRERSFGTRVAPKREVRRRSLVMRSVVVFLSALFCASLLFLAPAQSAPPPTSHINQSWSKTICCKKQASAYWSTDRQCRLAQGKVGKDKACHDADAKIK